MAPRTLIIRRLDAALDTMAERKMAVRAIYLTEQDHAAYDKAQSKAWGGPLACLQYSGHQIRRGTQSRIFSIHGVSVAVPKRVP